MDNTVCTVPRWQLLKQRLNNLDPQAFAERLHDEHIVLIDVRTPGEYALFHFPGALNIDYFASDFWERIEALDTRRTYLVYCRSGRRSVRTCTLMQNGGFRDVYNLDGGLKAWHEVYDEQAAEADR